MIDNVNLAMEKVETCYLRYITLSWKNFFNCILITQFFYIAFYKKNFPKSQSGESPLKNDEPICDYTLKHY